MDTIVLFRHKTIQLKRIKHLNLIWIRPHTEYILIHSRTRNTIQYIRRVQGKKGEYLRETIRRNSTFSRVQKTQLSQLFLLDISLLRQRSKLKTIMEMRKLLAGTSDRKYVQLIDNLWVWTQELLQTSNKLQKYQNWTNYSRASLNGAQLSRFTTCKTLCNEWSIARTKLYCSATQ